MKKKVTINLPETDAIRLAEVLDAFAGASEHLIAVLAFRLGVEVFAKSPSRFKRMCAAEMARRASVRRGR